MAQEFQSMLDAQKKWWDTWANWAKPQPSPNNWMAEPAKTMEKWMQEGNSWIRKTFWDQLPQPMQPHYSNYNKLYDEMAKYWEGLRPMVQFGMFDPKLMDQFFAPKAYEQVIGQFMGYKAPSDISDMLKQSTKMFERYQEAIKYYDPTTSQHTFDQAANIFKAWTKQDFHPAFSALVDITDMVNQSMDRFFLMAGEEKSIEIAQLLKEMQFTYTAFLLRTTEMQLMVFQPSRAVLTQTLQDLYSGFQESGKMPQFNDFFGHFVNLLETSMLNVLNQHAYSKLQAEVSKLGITVKSQMDKLFELTFCDLPFLTKSHADEVAKENTDLKRKIRNLERRMVQLEAHLGITSAPVAVPAPATQPTPQERLLALVGQALASGSDDLKQIKGIGPKLEKLLNGLGIFTYQQLAKMNAEANALVDALIPSFKGRSTRDNWASQAAQLLA